MTAPAPLADDRIEAETQALGRRLVGQLREAELSLVDAEWWEEKILEFCMDRPDLKVELFRFIDVLPALKPAAVTEHLLEYLGHARDALPAALRWSVGATPSHGAVARLVARAARRNVATMARRFIAGSTTGEAIAAVRKLRRERMGFTLDVLGEAVITNEEADAYRDQYVRLIRRLTKTVAKMREDPLIDRDHDGAPLPRVNVSLKLSALAPLFDPIDPEGTTASVLPRLRAILDAAQETGAFVHVDMEHYEIKDLTLRIFAEALETPAYRRYPHVGIVLQAYLRDCERDLETIADLARRRGTPLWVRLVKGAYWDYETVIAAERSWPLPVFPEKWQTDASYERCTELLLDHADVLRPALASHNVRSLARALVCAEQRSLPERFVEFQTLYGMADPIKRALVGEAQRVRVYTPYGQLIPGMAYLVRRLLENTSNDSFLRHQMVEGRSIDELLARPAPSPRAPTSTPSRAEEPLMPVASPGSAPEGRPFVNEPLQDFSRPEIRQRVSKAIARIKKELGVFCPVCIEGHPVETAETIPSECPSDTRVRIGASASATAADADRAVESARRGLDAWRRTPVSERATLLERTAELLCERRDELIGWIAHEAGKPWRDADADVAEAVDFCRYYAATMRDLGRPRRLALPGEENVTTYAPRGVTAVIAPWNFPVAILCGMTAASLVTGNATIMKPAEQTPVCAYQLFRAFLDAGMPPQALQFLPGPGEVAGARLVEHPDVATLVFTGSRAVGHFIARRAAETSTGRHGVKRVIAEMGGKNAIIVDSDADLDEAVPGVLASAFGYAGQKCSACSRVIVVDSIYERFLERARSAAASLIVGPADDPATMVGPLIDAEAVTRVHRYIEDGKKAGRVVYEGALGPDHAHGRFVAPTILADLPRDCSVVTEEIFGPVLAVMRASSFEEALELAVDTDYALTGGIYSRSPAHIDQARRDFDVGNLYINRKITGSIVGRQPFGGYRHSGMGNKAGGPDYLLQFLVAKTVTENTLRRGFAPPE